MFNNNPYEGDEAFLPASSRPTATRAEVIEECAKHFDERARALFDIQTVTTTRSEICRMVARELRDLKSKGPS